MHDFGSSPLLGATSHVRRRKSSDGPTASAPRPAGGALLKRWRRYGQVRLGGLFAVLLLFTAPCALAYATSPHSGVGRGQLQSLAGAVRVPADRGTGGIPDRLGVHVHRARRIHASLPASVDLSRYNPPVGNQGSVNSCSAWATMYYLRGWYANRDGYYPGGPDALGGFEPMFSYSQYSQRASLGFNHGMTLQGNLDILKAQGTDTRVDYWQGDFNQIDPPTPTELGNAANYKIASYAIATNNGGNTMQDSIQQTLATGNPVAITLALYSDDTFSSVGPGTNYVVYPPPAGNPVVNYHDVFAYKYDSTGLWIENQWGASWADKGFAELSWAYVNRAVLDAASIVPASPPPPPREPVGSLVATRSGSLYLIGSDGPVPESGYSAVGWGTEYGYTEDEDLPGVPNGDEYDCTPTACSAPDDDPVDPVITSVQTLAQYFGPPGWNYCAPEGWHCMHAGPTDVAYGAGGRYYYRYSAVGDIPCTNAHFQGDPAPNVVKACFTLPVTRGYEACAVEGGSCGVSQPTDVAYGAGGGYVHRYDVSGALQCSNAAMGGDPAPYIHKGCFRVVGPPGFTYCSTEGGTCTLPARTDVAYGTSGAFHYEQNASGAIGCSNATFGIDPAPNVHKACFTDFGPPGYRYCATEGGACSLPSTSDVAYGANGRYLYKYDVSGFIACNNAAMGADPAPYVVKGCFTVGGPPGFQYCATEGGLCHAYPFTPVAYGNNDVFVRELFFGFSARCNNTAFGADPTPYVHKACFAVVPIP